MKRGRKGGLCALCGAESDDGLYWEPALIVMDFGMPGVPIMEPDMSIPILCDCCHIAHEVASAYREDAVFSQKIYGAANARDALRLMGWEPTEALKKRLAE